MPQTPHPEILQHLSAQQLWPAAKLVNPENRDAMIDIAAARMYAAGHARLYLVPSCGTWAVCSRPTAGLDYIQVERDGLGGAVARLYRVGGGQ